MFKKVISFVLAAAMVIGVLCLTSCGTTNQLSEDERLPVTISVLGITEESTTPEAVKAVEKAINNIMGASYSTHISLTLVTKDEYVDLVKERVELANYNKQLDTAVNNYNTSAINAASNTVVTKSFGKWRTKVSGVEATTVTTREQYTSIRTEYNEQGVLEVVYPDAASPIDVVMIIGRDMYDELDSEGVLSSVRTLILGGDYPKFQQFIYPTYFELLQALTGDIKAIPNNNLLGEYTYVVVNKELADKYDFDIDTVNDYDDLESFLANVKAGESVIPMKTEPEALGIFHLFDEDGIAIGTYCDPIVGYDKEEGTKYTVQNIFNIPEYQAHLKLMEQYENAGYFTSESGNTDFAVDVIKGDASIEMLYSDDYYVKIVQNPFIEEEKIFDGMLAVSEYTSNSTRSMEFISELTTNSELKNLFQYGIEDVNYSVNEDGTIKRLNSDYMMYNGSTGNVYMGYPEEGMLADQWDYVKQTNLDTLLNPYLSYYADKNGTYTAYYYVNDTTLDNVLADALTRACMDEALAPYSQTYDGYLSIEGTTAGNRLGNSLKNDERYYDFFISEIMKDSGVSKETAKTLHNSSSNTSASKYPYSWYVKKITEYVTAEKYSNLMTASSLDTAILEKIASLAGKTTKAYENEQTKAQTYYTNIETLKIMARLVIWDDLSESEWAVYEKMSASDFENAVYEYVRDNYIKENNITDEKYETIVKAYICSQLKFTDPADNSSYTISWDEYMKAKEKASEFFGVIGDMKVTYSDLLNETVGESMLSFYSDTEIPGLVHDGLYSKWLSENGYKKSEFESSIYDEILEPIGITYSELMACRRKDTVKFTEYISKLKKQNKSILVEEFSLAQYKNDRISNDDVLETLLNNKIEEITGIYAKMCDDMGLSYARYKEGISEVSTFSTYANQMRTKFTYTLLTKYTQSEINKFTLNEIDSVVYDIISESGFYTNELCKYITTDLSTYMTKKSDTKAYVTSLTKITSALSSELTAKGYTQNDVLAMNIDEANELLYDIVKDEYFSDIITVEDMLLATSSEYVAGVDDAENVEEYITSALDGINENKLFGAVVTTLKNALTTALSAE